MKNITRRLAAAVLAAALAVSAVGCGGIALPAPEAPTPLETPAPTPVPTPVVEGPHGLTETLPEVEVQEGGVDDRKSDLVATDEYRAMWVSYLEYRNMVWDRAEGFAHSAAALMDDCVDMGLNTVILQVRPFADALYESDLFPWSNAITGTQGESGGYDPLAIMVNAAHVRGVRLEAWINPYRVALNDNTPGSIAGNNLLHTHPDWVKTVGEGRYLDPANPDVQDYICRGVAEILEKYDVDGIHFDDYFYPTTDLAFDAEEYAASGTKLSQADWRRKNVNDLVSAVYKTVKSIRPACSFGISPQGNNDNNYNSQYSDVALWLSTPGYVDYIMPQVYWGYGYTTKAGRTDYAFENVTRYWASLPRDPAVSLYFGLGAYRIGDGDGGNYEHAVDQWNTGHNLADMITTLQDRNCGGFALYRYDFLWHNNAYPELAEAEVNAIIALLHPSAEGAAA